MTERMKPPARRTGGRTLGGTKKTAPPPPPPTAELTHEQYAAEQAAVRGQVRPAAREPHRSARTFRRSQPRGVGTGAGPRRCPKWHRPSPSRLPRHRAAPSRSRPPVSQFTRPSPPPRRGQNSPVSRWSGRYRLHSRLPSPQHLPSSPRSRPDPLCSPAGPRLLAQPGAPRWRFALQILRRQAATGSR